MSPIPTPAALCRLDAAVVQAVRTGAGARALVVCCVATLALGTAAYGATMGIWRGPDQALFAAVKLVAMFAALLVLTTLTNAMMAGLLRARLSLPQVALCSLLGLTVTAAILGALAPVSLWFVAHAPSIGPDLDAALVVAQGLLAGHVVVFAIAGALGVRRMWQLVRELVADPGIARRVLWVWLFVEGLVGAQLSWVLRPFVGKPDLAITLLRADAWDSSFFDEIGRITRAGLGPGGPWVALVLALAGIVLVAMSLHAPTTATFEIEPDGLRLRPAGAAHDVVVPWDAIRSVQRVGLAVEIGRWDADALRIDTTTLPCRTVAAATAAYEAIEQARARPRGPFRDAPVTL
jgi:hypothetical protein